VLRASPERRHLVGVPGQGFQKLDAIALCRDPLEAGIGSLPRPHEPSAPARLRRVIRRALEQPGDRRCVTHLDIVLLADKEITECLVVGDVLFHEFLVPPWPV